MNYIMTVAQFIEKLLDVAKNTKTIYILGCFGAPMNSKNKARYTKNNPFNANRANIINACTPDTFGFDCVGLIKGILWGWSKDLSKTYGGASYKANGVPDVGANSMMNTYCREVSTDFKNIVPGEAVWMDGHIGVYIGDGKVVESTSKWTAEVLISSLGNLGYKSAYTRTWTKHGKLPWIDYSVQTEPKKEEVQKEEAPKVETPKAEATATKTDSTKIDSAKSYDKAISGTYVATADINLRTGANVLTKKKIALIPKGNVCKCYGYFTSNLGVKWLLIQTTIKGVKHTGFCHGGYLKKV